MRVAVTPTETAESCGKFTHLRSILLFLRVTHLNFIPIFPIFYYDQKRSTTGRSPEKIEEVLDHKPCARGWGEPCYLSSGV